MVQAMAMRHEASPTAQHVSVSCGVARMAAIRHAQDLALLLRQADAALYDAKAQGRNRCVAAAHTPG